MTRKPPTKVMLSHIQVIREMSAARKRQDAIAVATGLSVSTVRRIQRREAIPHLGNGARFTNATVKATSQATPKGDPQ